nr:hypothetical protein [Pirellulaceae bacterium]
HGYAVRKEYCGGKYDLRDTEADQRFGMQYWRNPERELADFLAETRQSPSGKIARLDEDATEESIRSTLKAVLRAGGVLHTGSTATAAKNGDPVSGPANIGAHAQTCFGFDDTDEFRSWYQTKTGKRLTEEVYLFDQTHGAVNYVRSNWPSHLWGQPTQGIFVLPWQYAKRLILSTCFCYWPDLGGATPDQVFRSKGV